MPIDSDSTPAAVNRFPVSVLTLYRAPSGQPWDAGHWDVIGVVASGQPPDNGLRRQLVHEMSGERRYLWTGLSLELYQDAADGYYHNLMSENPRAFVVCQQEENEPLEPCLVTVNYDEAAGHMEVEEQVFSVPLPPELYRWIEHFVLEHYVPEQRKKRKRKDWKEDKGPEHVPRSR